MSTDETAHLIRRTYEAYGRGDLQTVFAGLAEDIEWRSQGTDDSLPWAGRFAGHDQVGQFFARVAEAVTVETFEVLDVIVEGDRAAVVARITARLRTNGRSLTAEKADILQVRDGKIVRFTEYYDTGLVARTLAAPPEAQQPA